MTDLRPRSNRSRVPGIARHGRLKRSGPVKALLGIVGSALAVVLLSGASVGAFAVWKTAAQFEANRVVLSNETNGPPPAIGDYPGGFNILIVGSDTRLGQGGIGGNETSVLNDVNMLLHVSEDHTSAVAVSFPRDLVVPMPRCPTGGPATGLPINNTLSYGGLDCVVLTMEQLTGLSIPFAGVIEFTGVIEMSNAIGGVDVCITAPINDPFAQLFLDTAGTHTLEGHDALAFLRSRKGVGDGSDLGRISSQQVYLSSMVRKLKGDGTLTNPATVYKLASAAGENVQLSSSLQSIPTLIAIAGALKDIPLDQVKFVQYPGFTGGAGIYAGKVQPDKAAAEKLLGYIRRDEPFDLGATDKSYDTVADPNAPVAEPDPDAPVDRPVLDGVVGQSAAEYKCTEPNRG